MYDRFRPGKTWYDTAGKKIQAHGGSILYHGGKYFWYGENKEGVTGRATGSPCSIWHNGVRLYSSTDLYNWTDEGVILVEKTDENSPFFVGRVMDRPHILFNEKTGKFVLWAKIGGLIKDTLGFNEAYFAVATSDSLYGGFTVVNKIDDLPVGDFDLVQEDGRAYVVFGKPHTEVLCRELTDDYTGVKEAFSSHLPRPFPPFAREAPAYFKRGDRRFLLTSGTTGYFPNRTEVCEISAFHGEWKELGNACEGKGNEISFHAQFSSVFKHPQKDLYIALGDRWLTDLPPDTPSPDEMFESFFNEAKRRKKGEEYDLSKYTDENTSEGGYVWLPVCFREDGTPYIRFEAEWKIDKD